VFKNRVVDATSQEVEGCNLVTYGNGAGAGIDRPPAQEELVEPAAQGKC
jgi:hypothetical protein